MKLIDCNTRVGRTQAPISPLVTPTADALLQRMDVCGVSYAFCRHDAGREQGPRDGDARIIEICAAKPRLKPVLTVTPLIREDLGGMETFLTRAKACNAAALRIYPKGMGFSAAPYAMEEIAEIAETLSVPVMVDMAEIEAETIANLAKTFPRMNMIVTEIYYRNLRNLCPIFRHCDNLYLETGMLKTFHSLEDLCSLYGAERLVFGSGAPYQDMGAAVAHLLAADICDDEKELIASGNIKRLCGGLQI